MIPALSERANVAAALDERDAAAAQGRGGPGDEKVQGVVGFGAVIGFPRKTSARRRSPASRSWPILALSTLPGSLSTIVNQSRGDGSYLTAQ